MQSRAITRAIPKRIPLTKVFKPAQTRTMSFHPHSFLASASPASTSFTPLFRLLDDFDTYTRASPARTATTFNPKFDARELPTHFELHGELAGVNQRDITIEFTDPQTLSIRGRSERSYTSGTPPATIEAGKPTAAIEEGATTQKADHQPSVEDEDAASTTVTAQSVQAQKPKEQKPKESEERLWVSERSVGSFARSFTFPGRIDQDAVTASMKDGILTVVVPKAKKHESRKIQIS